MKRFVILEAARGKYLRKHILFEAELHDGSETLAQGPTHEQNAAVLLPEDLFRSRNLKMHFLVVFLLPLSFFPLISFLTSRPCHCTVKLRDAAAVQQLAPPSPPTSPL